jgi:tetratricopeptide (TPR) repeat protein
VVLEYDDKTTAAPVPAPAAATSEDPAQVARAREAYHRGNQKLFSGDTDGALAAYRESLKIYPGYVAGYRGLGLAYAEAGKREEALDAFRTYVKTVPAARDIPLIKKRIERLEKK